MLETPVLLLRPTVVGQPRVIADAVSGKPLGFARLQPDAQRGWLGSLLGSILAIHEQEEEPLVFTVRRCLLWTQREVRDAEGERVGYLGRGTIRDRNRLLYAHTRFDEEGMVYQCVNGAVLAATRPTPPGLELSFTKVIEGDPFAKMLLLAAALFLE
jgi:hypothetical protein